MTSKIKTALIGVVVVFVILIVASLLASPNPAANNAGSADTSSPAAQNNNSAPAAATEPPPAPVFQSTEKNYQIIQPRQDGTYRARDLATNKEVELFIPEGSIFTAGDRGGLVENAFLTATRYLEGANGLVVSELTVSTKQ